jgi:hypothetical protein
MSFIFAMMEEERAFNAWAKETFGGGKSAETPENIALIERNHVCSECKGKVSYVKKFNSENYEFVCNECEHRCDNAPLKQR